LYLGIMNFIRNSIYSLIWVCCFYMPAKALNTDSLWTIWNSALLHDTIRLKALDVMSWEGFGYSQPDSAYKLAALQYEFAYRKKYPVWMARALITQGNTWVIRSEYFKGYNSFVSGLELSEKSGDSVTIATALHRLGIVYFYQGDLVRAIDYYMRSLAIREAINDIKGISGTLNNIGIVYSQLSQFEEAIDFFGRSLKLSQANGDQRGIASAINNIGLVYKSEKMYERANEQFIKSLKISESLGDVRDMAANWNNIGIIYQETQKYREALDSYGKSVELKRSIGDKQGLSISLSSIGNIYQALGNNREAIRVCREALETATEIGALPEQKKACECLYNNYKELKNGNKALEYHEKMLSLTDSLRELETNRMLHQMEFSRQVLADSIARADEKNKLELQHSAEVRRKNKIRNILLGSVLVLLFGTVAMYTRIRLIRKSRAEISREKERSEKLLLNILPEEVARELKEKGEATAKKFESVSVLFTDFSEFTRVSSEFSPEELVKELNTCFREFDSICAKYNIEKIKTIGDAYMAAGGIPVASPGSAANTVMAALEMNRYMLNRGASLLQSGKIAFRMRIGIHTGPVVAGIVGVRKFQYDLWGDTVNIASRMESSGEPGKVNISRETYDLIKNDPNFLVSHRGKLEVKGKGCTEMYFVSLENNEINSELVETVKNI
jgi:adenylate cyclase